MRLKGILYMIIGLMSAYLAWLIFASVTADSGHFSLYFVVQALVVVFSGPYIFVLLGLIIAALLILLVVLRFKDKAQESAILVNQDQTIPKSVLFASSTIIVILSVGMFACFGVSFMLLVWSSLGGAFDFFEFWSAFFFAIGLLQATMTFFLIRKLPSKDNTPGSNSDEITS